MSKGFGFQREKRLLAKAAESRDADQFQAIFDKLRTQYGAERVTDWLMEILSTVSPDSMAWAYIQLLGEAGYKEMGRNALEGMCQGLIAEGFKPGKDFSIISSGELAISTEAQEAILAYIPEESRKYAFSDCFKYHRIEDPVQTLESHLGVPFIPNLLNCIEARIPNLSDVQATNYIMSMATGVEARTGIKLLPIIFKHLITKLPEKAEAVRQFLVDPDFCDKHYQAPGPDPMLDLIAAAGGEGEITLGENGYRFVSRRGLELLATVFQGERSVYELIAALDKHQRNQKGG